MKQMIRILAVISLAVIGGLIAAALYLAVTGAPKEQLMAIFFALLFFSVLIYAMSLMKRVLDSRSDEEEDPEDSEDSEDSEHSENE